MTTAVLRPQFSTLMVRAEVIADSKTRRRVWPAGGAAGASPAQLAAWLLSPRALEFAGFVW
jgi:hypothetical protein